MAVIIEDGTGKGYKVGVNQNNRMDTLSIMKSREGDVSERTGEAFLIASDFISLTTTGSFNALMYIKNTNTSGKNLFISKIRACSTETGNLQIRLIKNPTSGSIISDANAADQLPGNLGSSVTFTGDAYAASGDGKTIVDGTNLTQFINKSPGHSIQDYAGALIIPQGQSLALTCKPNVANTVCIEFITWFEEPGL